MKNLKVWFFTCLVFAFISLETLIDEGHEVIYEESNETEPVEYLICAKLSDLYPNQTKIDLKQLRDDLSDYFNRLFDWKKKVYKNGYTAREFKEFVRNRTKSGGYLVLNRKACLIANRSELKDSVPSLYDLLRQGIYFTNFAIVKRTFSFVQVKYLASKVDQLTVLKKGPPYSDCSQSNARFHCLNECFKRKARLSRYFYDSNETGLIQLNFSDRSIEQRNCFGECKRENCEMTQLISIKNDEGSKSKTFEAQPKLSAFNYWVQAIGLIVSFAGLSYNEFASVAIEFTRSKVKRRRVRIALFYLKFTVLFFTLASFGYLCALVVFDYHTNRLITKETRHFINPKIVHLVICVDISRYVVDYKGKTMWEIEKATDGALNDVLKKSIYLEYQSRSFRTDYHVRRKIWFKKDRRCFFMTIQPTYWTMPSDPKLTIEFEKRVYPELYPQVYLLSEDENLNSNSFIHSTDLAFQRRIVKRLKSRGRCVDYKEKYTICTGRRNCVERCIVRRYMKMYKSIPSSYILIVDRDSFSAIEWNTTQLMILSYEHFDSFKNITEQCLQEIPAEEPCLEIKFEKTVTVGQPSGETEKIDLRFDVVRSVEAILSPYKLALDLVNMQSIFFGFTVFSILQMTSSFLQRALKVRKNKLVLFIVYLLCSIGAIWNTVGMLDVIVNGELVPTEYYELVKRVQMPALVFCLRFDKNLIDPNHQLTGNYLEELTRQMTAESQFINIRYLDESNEWIPFDRSRIERFFLLDMKCFRIKIDQVYGRDQFYLKADNQVLKANLSRTRDNRLPNFYFMTKNEETTEFSKIVKLNPYMRSLITHETSLYRYEDRFSFIRRHVPSSQEESTSDLSAINLQEQLVALQGNEHNLRTLNLPLEEEAFGFEVNEDLFEQLYSVQKQKNQPTNYQQTFVANHLRNENLDTIIHQYSGSEFTFSLVFLQKIVHSTNEETFSKLILSLLNLLCFWFDLGVLDLHLVLIRLHLSVNFPDKIKRFLLFTCKWLKQLKRRLNEIR